MHALPFQSPPRILPLPMAYHGRSVRTAGREALLIRAIAMRDTLSYLRLKPPCKSDVLAPTVGS